MTHEDYMALAIEEAHKAYALKEVPIGAIIVYQDQVIGKGHNRRNTDKSPLAHGEILAIQEAAAYMGDWRLEECTMYITLEPCPMCAGAIVQARIPTVVLGARNLKSGSGGTLLNILQEPTFNHQVAIIDDIMVEDCQALLKSFFKDLRQAKKKQKEADAS